MKRIILKTKQQTQILKIIMNASFFVFVFQRRHDNVFRRMKEYIIICYFSYTQQSPRKYTKICYFMILIPIMSVN